MQQASGGAFLYSLRTTLLHGSLVDLRTKLLFHQGCVVDGARAIRAPLRVVALLREVEAPTRLAFKDRRRAREPSPLRERPKSARVPE